MKWINVRYYFPGYGCDRVLCRYLIDGVVNTQNYVICSYKQGIWIDCYDGKPLKEEYNISHWCEIDDEFVYD